MHSGLERLTRWRAAYNAYIYTYIRRKAEADKKYDLHSVVGAVSR